MIRFNKYSLVFNLNYITLQRLILLRLCSTFSLTHWFQLGLHYTYRDVQRKIYVRKWHWNGCKKKTFALKFKIYYEHINYCNSVLIFQFIYFFFIFWFCNFSYANLFQLFLIFRTVYHVNKIDIISYTADSLLIEVRYFEFHNNSKRILSSIFSR